MKQNKLVYYGSAVLIGVLLFIILISYINNPEPNEPNQEETDLTTEPIPILAPATVNYPPRTTETFAAKEGLIIPINSEGELADKGLLGTYWNHPYIRENEVEEDDQAISVFLDKETNTLILKFEEYLPRVDADGDVEIVARYDCRTTLTRLSTTTFALNDSKETCLKEYNKLCFLEKDGLRGISFDGETISFYRDQKTMPAFDSKTLLQTFFPLYELVNDQMAHDPDDTGEYVEFGKIEYYQEKENHFALVSFMNSIPIDYGSRLTDEYHHYMSVAKFKENTKGMYLLEFSKNCACGTYTRELEFPLYEIAPFTLQKIGDHYFLIKPVKKRKQGIYSITLFYYNTDDFEEAFQIKTEEYQFSSSNEKVYSLQTKIEYTEEDNDCGIIVNYLNTDSKKIGTQNQDIYIYDTEKDIFFKPS
ncbi:MAG: hypothetical protein GY810_02300 [Aureispira sp.]|nr:hypothetical protein [Aureispira sp.]